MTLAELIKQLKELQAEHGDLRVTKYASNGGVINFRGAKVRHIRNKRPRESKVYYAEFYERDEEGEKVIEL